MRAEGFLLAMMAALPGGVMAEGSNIETPYGHLKKLRRCCWRLSEACGGCESLYRFWP